MPTRSLRRSDSMSSPLLNTNVGKKAVVAATGLIMFGFVVGHLIGNLQIFMGAARINDYAKFLHHTTSFLWGTRIILLTSVFLHFAFTVQLAIENRASRPIKYAMHEPVQASIPSRFMIWSGIFLLLY